MGFSIQRLKETVQVGGSRLTVGSHATCDFVLDDPVAARAHAVLTLGPRGVAVEPLPTSTGAFLDGELIEGSTPFPVGGELVLGTSRLRLESFDAATSLAVFAVRERSFFHVEKKRGVFRSDADEAVRSEVRFGRYGALRGLNALVILGLLALVGGWAFGALKGWEDQGRVWASPGVLAGAHLAGFAGPLSGQLSGQPGGQLGAREDGVDLSGWSAAQLAHAENGCAACHVGEDGDYAGEVSCSGCHDNMLRDLGPKGRHPFRGADEVDCQSCHRIHGGDASLRGVAFHGQGCSDCHDQSSADLAQLLSSVEGPLIGAPKPRSIGNAGFRHQDHASPDSANCASCHEVDAAGEHYSLTGGAELCFGCHGDEAKLAADRATRGLDGERPVPVSLTLEEHGRAEELCIDCHDSVQDPEPPVATLVPAEGSVALSFEVDRHHTGRDQECSQCHLKPLREKPKGRTPAFDHGLHVGLDCRSCHYRAELPSDLVAEPWGPADLQASCIACHRDGDGALTVAFAAKDRPAEVQNQSGQARFSHAQHAAGNACADCHVVPDGDAAGEVIRSARDCASCHYDREARRHTIPAKVEECSRCHPSVGDGHPSGAHSLADLFAAPGPDSGGAPVAPSAARAGSLFSHALQQHAAVQCAQCHGWSGSDIEEASAPVDQRQNCRNCHQIQRFHWR